MGFHVGTTLGTIVPSDVPTVGRPTTPGAVPVTPRIRPATVPCCPVKKVVPVNDAVPISVLPAKFVRWTVNGPGGSALVTCKAHGWNRNG